MKQVTLLLVSLFLGSLCAHSEARNESAPSSYKHMPRICMQHTNGISSAQKFQFPVQSTGSLWVPQSAEENFTNSNGNSNKYKHTYEYNEKGLLISDTKIREGESVVEKTEYVYNENGKCILKNYFENGNKKSSTAYKYDNVDKDCMISKIATNYWDNDQVVNVHFDCQVTRDEKGRIQSLKINEYDYVYTTTFIYGSNNQPVSIIETDDTENSEYSNIVWDRYDGSLLNYLSANKSEIERCHTSYTYGGCRLKSATLKFENDEGVFTAEYNGNNYVANIQGTLENENISETYTFKQTDEYGSGEFNHKSNIAGNYDSKTIIKFDSHSNLIYKYECYTGNDSSADISETKYNYVYHPTYDCPSALTIETKSKYISEVTEYTFYDFKKIAESGVEAIVQEPQISREGDYLTVNCPGMKGAKMFDINGRLVRNIVGAADQATFTLRDLPEGIYFIQLEGLNKKQVLKIAR